MCMGRTILILTSKTGGGHISIANALRERIEQVDHHTTIKIIDPQGTFFHWHYRMVTRHALWLWETEFRLMDDPRRAFLVHRIFTQFVAQPLLNTIINIQPDLIITTYPFLSAEVTYVLDRHKLHIPFAMIFTDPNQVHSTWLTEKHAAATLAPTRETYEQALEAGFDPTRLFQTGWPVRAQFSRTDIHTQEQRTAILSQLNLDPQKFALFVQGGGEGATHLGNTVRRLLNVDPNLQIILATGTNKDLQRHFEHVPRISTLTYTKEIAPYMAAADIIMGKAGPNILLEAVTLGKPFIATAYIPGQEERNLDFIERHRLGWTALTIQQQYKLLQRLINNPEEVQSMVSTVKAYRDWNNAQSEQIVPVIEKLLFESIQQQSTRSYIPG